jgi:cytochrome c oxidase subunit 3
MWIFLATEVMFFGGLFLAYAAYRTEYPRAFISGGQLVDLRLGTINTAVLLSSSLTMAFAVHYAEQKSRIAVLFWLSFTLLFGASFLLIKGLEYAHDFDQSLVPGFRFVLPTGAPRQLQLFFVLYFFMTGLHAVHLLIGIILLSAYSAHVLHGPASAVNGRLLHLFGLYWHFVDIVWIFLFPLLYLIQRTR